MSNPGLTQEPISATQAPEELVTPVEAEAPLLSLKDIGIGNTIQLSWVQNNNDENNPTTYSKLAVVQFNPLFPEAKGVYTRVRNLDVSQVTFYVTFPDNTEQYYLVSAACCDFTESLKIRNVYRLLPYS